MKENLTLREGGKIVIPNFNIMNGTFSGVENNEK